MAKNIQIPLSLTNNEATPVQVPFFRGLTDVLNNPLTIYNRTYTWDNMADLTGLLPLTGFTLVYDDLTNGLYNQVADEMSLILNLPLLVNKLNAKGIFVFSLNGDETVMTTANTTQYALVSLTIKWGV